MSSKGTVLEAPEPPAEPVEQRETYTEILQDALTPDVFRSLVAQLTASAMTAKSANDVMPLLKFIEQFVGNQDRSADEREKTLRARENGIRRLLLRYLRHGLSAKGGVPKIDVLLAELDADGVDEFLRLLPSLAAVLKGRDRHRRLLKDLRRVEPLEVEIRPGVQ